MKTKGISRGYETEAMELTLMNGDRYQIVDDKGKLFVRLIDPFGRMRVLPESGNAIFIEPIEPKER